LAGIVLEVVANDPIVVVSKVSDEFGICNSQVQLFFCGMIFFAIAFIMAVVTRGCLAGLSRGHAEVSRGHAAMCRGHAGIAGVSVGTP
jgi:hypothetical protein